MAGVSAIFLHLSGAWLTSLLGRNANSIRSIPHPRDLVLCRSSVTSICSRLVSLSSNWTDQRPSFPPAIEAAVPVNRRIERCEAPRSKEPARTVAWASPATFSCRPAVPTASGGAQDSASAASGTRGRGGVPRCVRQGRRGCRLGPRRPGRRGLRVASPRLFAARLTRRLRG